MLYECFGGSHTFLSYSHSRLGCTLSNLSFNLMEQTAVLLALCSIDCLKAVERDRRLLSLMGGDFE